MIALFFLSDTNSHQHSCFSYKRREDINIATHATQQESPAGLYNHVYHPQPILNLGETTLLRRIYNYNDVRDRKLSDTHIREERSMYRVTLCVNRVKLLLLVFLHALL